MYESSAMGVAPNSPEVIEFGHFRLVPGRRELSAGDEPIKLGGRAFDVLMALIARPGVVVTKADLIARAWPDRMIGENNLQTQILNLRRALGTERDLIRTVPGRGYQFAGEIRTAIPAQAEPVSAEPSPPAMSGVPAPTNLPQPVSELIGREGELEEVANLVLAGRLVTLTGTGGIGKTRLALAVARRMLSRFPDGVWLVELATLTDPNLVPATVAAAVGLQVSGGELSARRVAQALAARHLLVVLDTCEHVIDAAAGLAEALLRAGSAARVIATSREPLRAEAEQLYPVAPLQVPDDGADDKLDHGAVRLFLERARAVEPDLEPDQAWRTTAAAICRRLDGIPLAIEMAAARVALLGVEGLAARLDGRLQLLTGGRRTALPRHQTLRAMLDWSHELLAEPERVLLRRLAVFSGPFSLEAVDAVAAGADAGLSNVVDDLASLVAKSLVVVEPSGGVPRYRMLDTTRAYAHEKLVQSGEREKLARLHAEYHRNLFERAEAELEMRPTVEWLGDYRRQIDNLRAAVGWAFSSSGDVEIGVSLTAAATPLWMLLSLFEECRDCVEQALTAHAVEVGGNERRTMKLYAALGASVISGATTSLLALDAIWTRTLEIAENLDDIEYQLRSLWGLWVTNWVDGQHRIALMFARKFRALAARRSDRNDELVGERLIGVSEHFMGALASARRHLEHMLAHYVPPLHQAELVRFQIDQRVVASAFLGRILWLQGFPEQALRAAAQCVNEVRPSDHAMSMSYILAHGAYPVALWTGDLALAECYATILNDLSTRHSLGRWRAYGEAHRGILAVRRGQVTIGLQLLQSASADPADINAAFRLSIFLAELAHAQARVGKIEEGLALLAHVIRRADETEERWCMPEMLRSKGELLLLQGAPGAAAAAEDHFRRALDWAGQQGALSWELRAATSLARLLRDQGQRDAGIALLRPLYDRFTEGFDTADLRAAKLLLL